MRIESPRRTLVEPLVVRRRALRCLVPGLLEELLEEGACQGGEDEQDEEEGEDEWGGGWASGRAHGGLSGCESSSRVVGGNKGLGGRKSDVVADGVKGRRQRGERSLDGRQVASTWGPTALVDRSDRNRRGNASETSPAVEETCCDPFVRTPSPSHRARDAHCHCTVHPAYHPVCPAHPVLALAILAARPDRHGVPRRCACPAQASVAASCYACSRRAAVRRRRRGRDCRGASKTSGGGRRGRLSTAASPARIPSSA